VAFYGAVDGDERVIPNFALRVGRLANGDWLVSVDFTDRKGFAVQGPPAMLHTLILQALETVDPLLAVELGANAKDVLARLVS
jgi:hypothetical protein